MKNKKIFSLSDVNVITHLLQSELSNVVYSDFENEAHVQHNTRVCSLINNRIKYIEN